MLIVCRRILGQWQSRVAGGRVFAGLDPLDRVCNDTYPAGPSALAAAGPAAEAHLDGARPGGQCVLETVEQPVEHAEAAAGVLRDRGKTLSILWVFATVNYIYCDVLAFMDHDYLRQVLTGSVGGLDMTRGLLLGASVLMEVPMAMILLSWVLRPGPSRIANLVAGSVMTAVQLSTLFGGSAPTPSYVFFSVVEIATTAFIVWYAWTWPKASTGT
jgi:hypothetical protein